MRTPRTAVEFNKVRRKWEKEGRPPCGSHSLERWYPDHGLPHEGWACTKCGEYFEDRSERDTHSPD